MRDKNRWNDKVIVFGRKRTGTYTLHAKGVKGNLQGNKEFNYIMTTTKLIKPTVPRNLDVWKASK